MKNQLNPMDYDTMPAGDTALLDEVTAIMGYEDDYYADLHVPTDAVDSHMNTAGDAMIYILQSGERIAVPIAGGAK